MTFPGPSALGRGIVVENHDQIPVQCQNARTVVLDESVIAEPAAVVRELHDFWLNRRRIVVVVPRAVSQAMMEVPDFDRREPYQVGVDFEFPIERLRFLLGANNYDLRGGQPVWHWSGIAHQAFKSQDAEFKLGGPADVQTFKGPAWCDGGPRQPIDNRELGGFGLVHRDTINLGRLKFDRAMSSAANLSEAQMAAVVHAAGPAMVIACAGAGKTTMMTTRLKHLIQDRGWDAEMVMAVAYNSDAAAEMRERMGSVKANIRTLNSLGLAVVNGTEGFLRPRRPSINPVVEFKTLNARKVMDDEGMTRAILGPLLPGDITRERNKDAFVPYLDGMSAIRLALMDPEEAEAVYEAPDLARIFPLYRKALSERKVIDFDGQIYDAVEALLGDPVARKRAQRVARHAHVDEFQDLTQARLLLLRLMAAPTYEVMGVGDDDQTIYGYNGADPRFLINFDKYFQGSSKYVLETNYRCPPAVVSHAAKLLSHNKERVDKSIAAVATRNGQPKDFTVAAAGEMSATPIALDLIKEWNLAGNAWSSIAVLSRVKAVLLPMQVALADAKIPCSGPLSPNILKESGVQAVLACLRIANDPEHIEPADLKTLMARSKFRIFGDEVNRLTRSTTSIEALKRAAMQGSAELEDFVAALEVAHQAAQKGVTSDVFAAARLGIGVGESMDKLDESRKGGDRPSKADTLSALEQTAAFRPNPKGFERWLREMLSKGADDDGVKLSTIHKTKGAEWDQVIVWSVNEGLMPHRLAENVEEERRLMHVAMTRSRKQCVLMVDPESPSQFIEEMGASLVRERSTSSNERDQARLEIG